MQVAIAKAEEGDYSEVRAYTGDWDALRDAPLDWQLSLLSTRFKSAREPCSANDAASVTV